MTRIRTFIAVDTSPEVRRRAATLQDKLRQSEVKASWTHPENMHLTLQFLGDVDDPLIPEICQRVASATAPFAPFLVEFSKAGAFPAVDRPRTVWIGVDRGTQELVDLQLAIQESLVEMRFPRERRTYRPHLTIARVRESGRRQAKLSELLAHYRDFKAESCDIPEVLIMASNLDRIGPTYQVMGRAPLEG
ncbi:MAG: RNA 2',3'-cyclic phosphodiesterase [Planctomycetaceae bacterium]|nr:RNA 2',3'-cyclic phosphodiesterase [Planctomycetales bacterium]MCB9923596.1 RNA 2',3'-cyclic phosphodiesterase [Planctomycetaceae bacterium]